METINKLRLGVLSVFPILYFIFLLLFVPSSSSNFLFETRMFFVLIAFTILVILLAFIVWIYYIFKILRGETNNKALWLVLLCLLPFLVMPAYWYLHIWKEAKVLLVQT